MTTLSKRDEPLVLFEGQNGHLVPMQNYDTLSSGLFVIVGKMSLHAILNNCQGMAGLSPAVVAYLLTANRDACIEHAKLEDIPDPIFQDRLTEVNFVF